ncbi:MAG: hypothetical protein V1744_07735 [Candidatus Altiarchaeota archaeon]
MVFTGFPKIKPQLSATGMYSGEFKGVFTNGVGNIIYVKSVEISGKGVTCYGNVEPLLVYPGDNFLVNATGCMEGCSGLLYNVEVKIDYEVRGVNISERTDKGTIRGPFEGGKHDWCKNEEMRQQIETRIDDFISTLPLLYLIILFFSVPVTILTILLNRLWGESNTWLKETGLLIKAFLIILFTLCLFCFLPLDSYPIFPPSESFLDPLLRVFSMTIVLFTWVGILPGIVAVMLFYLLNRIQGKQHVDATIAGIVFVLTTLSWFTVYTALNSFF